MKTFVTPHQENSLAEISEKLNRMEKRVSKLNRTSKTNYEDLAISLQMVT